MKSLVPLAAKEKLYFVQNNREMVLCNIHTVNLTLSQQKRNFMIN